MKPAIDFDEITRRHHGGAFARAVAAMRSLAAGARSVSAPDAAAIAALERQRNRCADWSRVKITARTSIAAIHECHFAGDSLIDAPEALERARFENVFVGEGACVLDATRIRNARIGAGARVESVAFLGSESAHRFGLGTEIVFAPGGGARRLAALPDSLLDELVAMAWKGPHSEYIAGWRTLMLRLAAECETTYSLVADGARIVGCGVLRDVYVGEGCVLESVPSLREAILLGTRERPTVLRAPGPVARVIAQEDCEISGGALVDTAFLCEHAWARAGARVTSSIIGPNSGVGCGELGSSLIGPFVGFGHEALCIATFWPGGRGNISYGANVGSNHTGRAADQEIHSGEGVFYGLDCAIKFPFDSMKAPYSIIASGVVCLPQRIEFPYSLVNTPGHSHPSLSPAFNEIFPAWQVRQNLYGLLRNEEKYRTRNRALRHRIESRVFSDAMIEESIARLEAALRGAPSGRFSDGEEFYTDAEIPGLGKNYVRGTVVRQAIGDYRLALRLAQFFTLPDEPTRRAEEARRMGIDPAAVEREILTIVEDNRRRDDVRGRRTILDYADVHGETADDPLVRTWRARVESTTRGGAKL